VNLNVSHFISPNLEVKGDFEFGWGIKEIKTMMGSGYFNSLVKLSIGFYGNYHFTLKNPGSIYLGGGLNLNRLYLSAFDDHITGNSNPMGFSGQLGYTCLRKNARNKDRRVYTELQANIIKGKNKDNAATPVSEISFSGVSLKFGLMF